MAGLTEQTVGAEDWRASLLRSKTQIDAGQTVPLLPVLERLRASADRLDAERPEDVGPSDAQ